MARALPIPPVPLWRPVKADPRDYFSPEEVARSKAYQRPLQHSRVVSGAVSLAEILLLIGFDAGPRLVRGAGVGAWPVQLLLVLAAFVALDTVVSLPVTLWRYRHDKRWEFETRSAGLLAADTAKQTLLGVFIFALIFMPLWAVIRATRLWWLIGAVVLLLAGLVLALIGPTLQRLFNKFSPLEDASLRERLLSLAGRAGALVKEIFVMDASKRTRKDNAYFGGLGRTKRIVVFDNMLDLGHDAVEVVVAHEVGHWRRRHVVEQVVSSAVTGPLLLGVGALLLRWETMQRWAGIASERDPEAFPVLLLGLGGAFVVLTFALTWVSRWKERQADFDSLELTGNLDAYRQLWRRMPERNLPDLDPSLWQRVRASHPPVAERIAFASVWERARVAGAPGEP